MEKGRLFIISAPSGAGKTTLLAKVMPGIERLTFSVSHTTRKPRPGEQEGVNYYFVDRKTFSMMREREAFLEWAEVHGEFYGTSREVVVDNLEKGTDVILDIDVQGAEIIRKSGMIDAASIFIAPPDLVELERRLRGRAQDSEETILLRMKNARKEMQAIGDYEYLIINNTVDEAAMVLQSIILAERARMHRLPSGLIAARMIIS
jgi:guanylate kinase